MEDIIYRIEDLIEWLEDCMEATSSEEAMESYSRAKRYLAKAMEAVSVGIAQDPDEML